ncbi:trehalose-6-phosphate phosphatase [Cantharellus anzutake]|uniref:trehalose-6-phosphate phosphatase n=1 Tax=Cantharellus anzutake TaxID=1750568 RepID=UPI00190513EA|nr:trehalose-6-phosphate phosphatase [Cantharellus anzutake]KAF8343102.1 trehalose-6-phosphate phosphatase [Cantharellus anzutake]
MAATTHPDPPIPLIDSLDNLRVSISKLQEDHLSKGVPVSGRIIHVTHYIPIVATLESNAPPTASTISEHGVPTPPRTPDRERSLTLTPSTVLDIPRPTSSLDERSVELDGPKWSLRPRRGHSAMNSGIQSLCATHEQVIVGWTGDLKKGPGSDVELSEENTSSATITTTSIATGALTETDKAALEEKIASYQDPIEPSSSSASSKPLSYAPVWLNDATAHGHYDGYCKTTLWPLFHYLLWQDVTTELQPVDDVHWKAYVKANEAYAKKVAEVYQAGDLVWIHDYHCLLVPKMLRALVPDAYIGLFVHTPFPSSEVFRCLPKRKELLDGMLGANLVCFNTYSYARHFSSSCVRVCGYESTSNGIDVQGQVTTVLYCPVGIDADRVEKDLERPGIPPKMEAVRALYQGKKIIVGRDKLDVVKGVVQKLKAFEKLLIDYPEWRGKVVLIQVTSPSLTDSPKLERHVTELVSHINGEYGSLDFVPVHHYHQTIKKDEFYALLSVADLALITPLRDGMNTTSMEYIISQERTNKSPLVLSEFMGTSPNLSQALQVNPWDLGDVTRQINYGLRMNDVEKSHRQAALYKSVRMHTSHTWAAVLVKMLLSVVGNEKSAKQTPYLDRVKLRAKYAAANKRLLMFDYDGTLTPIVKTPSMAVPSKQTLEALQKLSSDPKNVVYIISGRDGAFLDQHLGHLSDVGFSAEHGSFLKEPGGPGLAGIQREWANLTLSLDMSWMNEVREIFEYYTERTTGSFVELKKSSVTWHYRASDPDWGSFQCKQCLDLLETNVAPKRPIEVLVGKMCLEVRPIAINKGEIVKRLLYNHSDAEFIFCAGDDKTDEDMFRALQIVIPQFSPNGASTPNRMEPPISASLSASPAHSANTSPKPELQPVDLLADPTCVFSTSVGPSTKKTLAKWHVTTPQEIVESILEALDEDAPEKSHL